MCREPYRSPDRANAAVKMKGYIFQIVYTYSPGGTCLLRKMTMQQEAASAGAERQG